MNQTELVQEFRRLQTLALQTGDINVQLLVSFVEPIVITLDREQSVFSVSQATDAYVGLVDDLEDPRADYFWAWRNKMTQVLGLLHRAIVNGNNFEIHRLRERVLGTCVVWVLSYR